MGMLDGRTHGLRSRPCFSRSFLLNLEQGKAVCVSVVLGFCCCRMLLVRELRDSILDMFAAE